MWGFENMKNLSWNCPIITAHVYIWPERGDVDNFLSKLAPRGQIADWIRIREVTADNDENGMICDFC